MEARRVRQGEVNTVELKVKYTYNNATNVISIWLRLSHQHCCIQCRTILMESMHAKCIFSTSLAEFSTMTNLSISQVLCW